MLVTDQGPVTASQPTLILSDDDTINLTWQVRPQDHFAYVRIYDPTGRMTMLANPIYIDSSSDPAPTDTR